MTRHQNQWQVPDNSYSMTHRCWIILYISSGFTVHKAQQFGDAWWSPLFTEWINIYLLVSISFQDMIFSDLFQTIPLRCSLVMQAEKKKTPLVMNVLKLTKSIPCLKSPHKIPLTLHSCCSTDVFFHICHICKSSESIDVTWNLHKTWNLNTQCLGFGFVPTVCLSPKHCDGFYILYYAEYPTCGWS